MEDETQAVGAALEPTDASPAPATEEITTAPEVEADPLEWEPDPNEQRVPLDRFKTVSQRAREAREQATQLQEQLAVYQPLEPWAPIVEQLQAQGLTPEQVQEFWAQQAAQSQAAAPTAAPVAAVDAFDAYVREKTNGYSVEELPEYAVASLRESFDIRQELSQQREFRQQQEAEAGQQAFAQAEQQLKSEQPIFQNDALYRPLLAFAATRWDAGDTRTLSEIGKDFVTALQPVIQQQVAAFAQAQGQRNASTPPVAAGGAAVPPSPPSATSYDKIHELPVHEQSSAAAAWWSSRQGSEV